MKKTNKLKLTLLAVTFGLMATTAAANTSNYIVDNDNSSVNFSVTKKQYIVEPAVFHGLEGSIDAKGNATISIDINSVDSSNPIRDNRLIEMFFQAEFFPEAIISAQIGSDILNSDQQLQQASIPATLELYETKREITLDVMIVKVGNDLVVTSLKPIIVNAKQFNIPTENLNALSKVCGGITISDIVPVNFTVTFRKK
jgi:polyisoprenoid-binding protein YceI